MALFMETPHISNIESFFDNHYTPANHIGMADTIVSTKQLYDALFSIFPFKEFTPEILHNWLTARKFKLVETGKLTFEWIMNKKIDSDNG